MLTVALTGGIGSGKSTVASLLQERGAAIFDVDAAARSVLADGAPAVGEIAARWPDAVDQGRVNRAALADIVFHSPQDLEFLNAIVHPRAWAAIDAQLARYAASHPHGVAVIDVPLLATSPRRDSFDLRVVVDADTDVRIRRLVGQRGMREPDVRARIAAQVTSDDLRRIADVWIDNSGDIAQLVPQVDRLWEKCREDAIASSRPKP